MEKQQAAAVHRPGLEDREEQLVDQTQRMTQNTDDRAGDLFYCLYHLD